MCRRLSARIDRRCTDFFFLMIRRPPRSTLFPTRRSSDLLRAGATPSLQRPSLTLRTAGLLRVMADHLEGRPVRTARWRSEEHTSELQSQSNLVCRLLLEKKKNCAVRTLSTLRHPHSMYLS